ncbi:MAG: hypothetical protein GY851_27870, partial [bacterium]|nr:hypothetical protein [bacterium]
ESEPTPWTPPLSGINHPYLFPLYPDAHASYWAYTFERDESMANMAIEIKGQFPRCRYMSLSCYDPDTASVIDDMRDTRIEPDEGCINPFRPQEDRADPNRSYTVYVVPEGSPWAHCANTIVVPSSATNTTLALRIYRPDEGCDIKGDVPLPEITAFNDLTGEVRPLPVRGREEQKAIAKRIVGVIRNVAANKDTLAAMQNMVDPQISFFRWKGEGYLPNADNA